MKLKKKFWELSASNVKLRRINDEDDKKQKEIEGNKEENLIEKIIKKPENFRLIAEIENGELLIRIKEKAE